MSVVAAALALPLQRSPTCAAVAKAAAAKRRQQTAAVRTSKLSSYLVYHLAFAPCWPPAQQWAASCAVPCAQAHACRAPACRCPLDPRFAHPRPHTPSVARHACLASDVMLPSRASLLVDGACPSAPPLMPLQHTFSPRTQRISHLPRALPSAHLERATIHVPIRTDLLPCPPRLPNDRRPHTARHRRCKLKRRCCRPRAALSSVFCHPPASPCL